MVGTAYPVTVSHCRALASSEVSYIFIVFYVCFLGVSVTEFQKCGTCVFPVFKNIFITILTLLTLYSSKYQVTLKIRCPPGCYIILTFKVTILVKIE